MEDKTKFDEEFEDELMETDDEYEEPGIEPEWCEYCLSEEEETGIEYTPDFDVKNGCWVCSHCGRYV